MSGTAPENSSAASGEPSWPPPLAAGARVALVSPSGPVRDEQEVERAVENARSLGWEPVVAERARARHGYLAGPDAHRVADLNRAIQDDEIDGIWCIRGGYGAMRLLDALELHSLRTRPKALIGYSDITAIHLALRAYAGVVSFHGPTARAELTPFSRDSLARAVSAHRDPCGVAEGAQVIRGGRARGPLVGGNLTLVASLIGTPYALELDGALLVLEDVNEPVYRLDRALQQLRHSGALARCAGVLFGSFTERGDDAESSDAALASLQDEVAALVDGPVLAGVPVGHIPDQWTLPVGAAAELDADARRLSVLPPPA